MKSQFSSAGFFQFLILIPLIAYKCSCEEFCHSQDECTPETSLTRYLLYDVNYPEGFNLRRDVYMRFAILARHLKRSGNPDLTKFKLVLPPWSRLVHWEYSQTPEQIPWSLYFDLESLQRFAPVIEMKDFVASNDGAPRKVDIDEVYVLQHFEDMFETGNFKDRMEMSECLKEYRLNYFFYDNVTSDNVRCLSFHGPSTLLIELLENTTATSVFIDHGEIVLHPMYGDKTYWMARRSMRFNKELVEIAASFRRKHLNSSDSDDGTVLPENWMDEKPNRKAAGGPYLGVHIRRRDFVLSRPNQSPSLESIARQIDDRLTKLGLETVFVATDASKQEYEHLKSLLTRRVIRYVPGKEVKSKFGDGGAAIIDQIICSHARYFIGTHESTFSFRIQEEREIKGFPVASTFNSFCKEGDNCEKPSIWKIVH